MRDLLGGKGANVAEMTRVLGPELVPGRLHDHHRGVRRVHARRPHAAGRASTRRSTRRSRASRSAPAGGSAIPHDPLLVSVRSGARDSMPGMMDTVLNLGLNDESVEGLAARTGNPRFAWDSYRRLVQMFGDVVRGMPGERFEDEIARIKRERGVHARHRARRRRAARADARASGALRLPDRPARAARAGDPRRLRLLDGRARRRLPPHQRDPRRLGHGGQRPADGLRQQGPDLGLGRGLLARRGHRRAASPAATSSSTRRARTSSRACARRATCPSSRLDAGGARPAARRSCARLERHYKDMQDTEFTVEEGRLYMLQTRNAKRPAQAARALRGRRRRGGPADARREAIATIDARSLHALLHPTFDPAAQLRRSSARGVAASPGAAKGAIVFTAPDAVAAAADGRDGDPRAAVHRGRRRRRLLRRARGSSPPRAARPRTRRSSRAAWAARRSPAPATLDIDLHARRGAHRRPRPARGRPDRDRRHGRRPSRSTTSRSSTPEVDARFETVLGWCDELRTLGVRANADTPEDAAPRARVRRRGHRAVPDRAHVHGRRPPAEDAAR